MRFIEGTIVTIALAKDVEDFLKDQVRSGVCTDASELINDLIRSLREQREKPFETTPELEAWLLESAEKPVTELTKEDFNGIRERVEARTERMPYQISR
jgi:Arc/MetJ-type ribon-helix-helix transcriptional regulator